MKDSLGSGDVHPQEKPPVTDIPSVNEFVETSKHRSKKTGKERSRTKLSKEGKSQVQAEWQSLVTEGVSDFNAVREKVTLELDQIKKQRQTTEDVHTQQFLRLKELSFQKRLEHLQRIHIEGQMSASNSPWNEVKKPIIDSLYAHVSPKLAEVVVMDKIAKLKMNILDEVENQTRQGNISKEKKDALTAYYDKQLSGQMKAIVESKGDAAGNMAEVIGQLADGDVRAWIGRDIETRRQRRQEAIRKNNEVLLTHTLQRKEHPVTSAGQVFFDAEHKLPTINGEAYESLEEILAKLDVAEVKQQERENASHILKKFLGDVASQWYSAVVAAGILGMVIGGPTLGPTIKHYREAMGNGSQRIVRVSTSRLSAAAEAAAAIPHIDVGHIKAPEVTIPQVEVQVPKFPAQQVLAPVLDTSPKISPQVLPAETPAQISQPLPIEKQTSPLSRVTLPAEAKKVDIGTPEIIPVQEKPIQPIKEQAVVKEKIPSTRIGIRVTEPELISETGKMGIDYIRIAGNASQVKDGKFAEQYVEDLLIHSDNEGKSVVFVFNPTEVPPFDEDGRHMPGSVEELKSKEKEIKQALEERLGHIIDHKSVKYIVLGNEYNDATHFWKGDQKQAAYMMKLALEVLQEKNYEGETIIGAVAEASKNQAFFHSYIDALRSEGIDIQNRVIAVHGYTRADLETGVQLVKSVGGKPFIEEVGVNRLRADAPAVLQSLVSYALEHSEPHLPVMVHELKSFGVSDPTTNGAEYSVLPGSALAKELIRVTQTPEAKPAQTFGKSS